jgi:prefoldin subunit 5
LDASSPPALAPVASPPDALLAVVLEKLRRQDEDFGELKQLLTGVNGRLDNLQNIPFRLDELNRTVQENKESINTIAGNGNRNTEAIVRITTGLRIFGTLALLCVGLVGWGYTKLENIHRADVEIDRRVLLLEFQQRGITQKQGEPK